MRMLMLAPHPGVRGPLPKHTPVLVDGLRTVGCEVVLEPWGRHHDREPAITKLRSRPRDILTVRRRLQSERFDLMVVKTSHLSRSLARDLPLLAATRGLVPKTVVQFHGGRSDLLVSPGQRAFKLASAALFALCDGVLVLSTEEAVESHRFWPRGRFRVVANPFRAYAENGAAVTLPPLPTQSGLRLLFVGRLVREKGIFEMIRAFSAVSRRHDCHLVVVGDGPAGADLAEEVSALGLDERVTMAGYLEGGPLRDAYRAADVFVFPSYREGFPTAITEAMAEGLPVITTRTRGMADHLVEGDHALFVPARDDEALAAALAQVLSDAALRERMSIANQAKVGDFAPEAVARQYLTAIQEIIGGPRAYDASASSANGSPAA